MDNALQTMIDNLEKNTSKSLVEWIELVKREKLEKHGHIIKFLKDRHGFTHGYANLVAHKANESDAGSAESSEKLIEAQYKGKEHFIPLYKTLIQKTETFGEDLEISPKKTYVSLRRKKQFAILKPATKTRFEICLNLKNVEPDEMLKEITATNAMCTHQINLMDANEISPDLIEWMKKAYDQAG